MGNGSRLGEGKEEGRKDGRRENGKTRKQWGVACDYWKVRKKGGRMEDEKTGNRESEERSGEWLVITGR